MDDERTLKLRSEDVVWREIDGQGVILDMRSGTYLTINQSAIPLWQHLAEGASPNELADLLRERFGIEAERALRDVRAFLGLLEERGLLS